MSLSLDDVKRIAELARIAIDADEAECTLADLNRIFGLIGEMQAVDTSNVEPMAHAQNVSLRLREDKIAEPDRREAFQALAPSVDAGLYLVPKVIE